MDVEQIANSADDRALECRARLDVLEVAFSMLAVMLSPAAAMHLEDELRAAPERDSGKSATDGDERDRLRMADKYAVRLADVMASRIARHMKREVADHA